MSFTGGSHKQSLITSIRIMQLSWMDPDSEEFKKEGRKLWRMKTSDLQEYIKPIRKRFEKEKKEYEEKRS